MDFLNGLELEPEAVDIDGVKNKVNIYRFSLDYMQNTLLPIFQEESVEVCALYVLNPEGYVHEEAHLVALRKRLSAAQIVQVFNEGLRVNGFNAQEGEEVKKDLEPTPTT